MTRQESKHVALVSIRYRYTNKRLCQTVTYSNLILTLGRNPNKSPFKHQRHYGQSRAFNQNHLLRETQPQSSSMLQPVELNNIRIFPPTTQCRDYTTAWTSEETYFDSRNDRRFISFLNHPNRLRGLSTFLVNGTRSREVRA